MLLRQDVFQPALQLVAHRILAPRPGSLLIGHAAEGMALVHGDLPSEEDVCRRLWLMPDSVYFGRTVKTEPVVPVSVAHPLQCLACLRLDADVDVDDVTVVADVLYHGCGAYTGSVEPGLQQLL